MRGPPIPANCTSGRAARNANDYAGWAGLAARAENAPFLDINEISAHKYDELGQEKVKALFIAGAGPHTSLAGAETNAICVVTALKSLRKDPLAGYFSKQAANIAALPPEPVRPKAGHHI